MNVTYARHTATWSKKNKNKKLPKVDQYWSQGELSAQNLKRSDFRFNEIC